MSKNKTNVPTEDTKVTTAESSAPRVESVGTEEPKVVKHVEAPSPTPVPLPKDSKLQEAVRDLTKSKVVAKKPADVVADLLKEVPPSYQYPILRTFEYIERMDPSKAENEQVGVLEQTVLFRNITTIINQDEYFQPLFTAMLRLFNTYSGERDVFHEYNCDRYMYAVTLNEDERRAFSNLTCMLRLFANPATRSTVARTTDHVRLLAYGLTEDGRNRVISYFNL